MQTGGARRSKKCGERSIKGIKTLGYRSAASSGCLTSLSLRPITEQSNTFFSALHHRNVNKLLETLASKPCLFFPTKIMGNNSTLDSGLLCLFFVLRVRLLLHCIFHEWMMIRQPPCTSTFCTFCRRRASLSI